MQELDFLFKEDLDWVFTCFLSLFSAGIALFYTFIFIAFYNENLKPSWLFFALLPLIIILTKIVNSKYVLFVFVLIFVGTFVLLLGGILKKSFITFRNWSKGKTIASVIFLTIKHVLIVLITIAAIVFLGPKIFIIIFAIAGIQLYIKYNSRKSFFNLQANLPTSKIQSLAMGLVEVVGNKKKIVLTKVI